MSNAVELYNQGVDHMQANNLPLAKEAFDAAINNEPSFAHAYNARAVVKALGGDYQEAISDVNEAIQVEPADGTFYRTRALIYREMGEEDKAVQDMERSEELSKNNDNT